MLPSLSSSSNYKSTWSSAEDELLLKAVSKWGPHDWYQIAIEMPGRLPRQCRERYKNHVREGINSAPFTREEDAIILTAQSWCVALSCRICPVCFLRATVFNSSAFAVYAPPFAALPDTALPVPFCPPEFAINIIVTPA